MLDTSPLTAAVERFADRLRSAPQSRLQRGAAAEALELARQLASRAQRLEDAARDPRGAAPARVVPDEGVFVVGDQVAVTGQDLAEALRGVREGESGTAPSEILDEAVRLVEQAELRAMR
ncbi:MULTISPECIES: hypothetical protein [unclassified Streptomyces]|uniref:hypothetical protein n=1 Tax=unclassified Streptomyces TaxID=2593676 RepID=UPI002E354006|nr:MULTISPECIES: hypothetical protein [unclassified Streptomyces]WUC66154.1 hypothetical protein OG861_19000 [Streptomyces sp. NBC_00539]